ncbi:uncharacterized protein C21orf140 homolog [Osmerus eperlanus]|uniref:uncharacterized protein C21orf140 homolog n=1 Tax=Osmerus eperlanus TaxID=29151 RepID=UPI002E121319
MKFGQNVASKNHGLYTACQGMTVCLKMHLRLRKLLQLMWNRTTNSSSQCTPYIRDIRKLQSNGFYRVYVGETDIPESLITGDSIRPTSMNITENRQTWSILHAGGHKGWVPWNYKLLFHCNGVSPIKPSAEIFEELCYSLRENYGKCAIVVNPHNSRASMRGYAWGSWMTLHHLPSGPVEFTLITCCPSVARSYGHELLQLPFQCAHLSPLNSAWSTVKWFANNNRGKYSETVYDHDTRHKFVYWIELMEGALKIMTKRKWEEAGSRVWKNESVYLND